MSDNPRTARDWDARIENFTVAEGAADGPSDEGGVRIRPAPTVVRSPPPTFPAPLSDLAPVGGKRHEDRTARGPVDPLVAGVRRDGARWLAAGQRRPARERRRLSVVRVRPAPRPTPGPGRERPGARG